MKRSFLLSLFYLTAFSSCRKAWLDDKSNNALVVPTTLADMQSLLDNTAVMNNGYPVLGLVSSGDYFVLSPNFKALPTNTEKNAYLWAADIFQGAASADWNNPYQSVFYANVVLDALSKTGASQANNEQLKQIQGSALFFRASSFYNLAQEFSPAYDSSSPGTNMGIPLRLTADINLKSVRSSVHQTYEQILQDLFLAKNLLPSRTRYHTRPTRSAALALLARCYLAMSDYSDAFTYADSCLMENPALLDYNQLDSAAPYPVPPMNSEEIFFAECNFFRILYNAQNLLVDTTLYASYEDHDLRKSLFFKPFKQTGYQTFRGSYLGSPLIYGGLATDEIYLIRAEAAARLGNNSQALSDLNRLRSYRYKPGYGMIEPNVSSQQLLDLALQERKKELFMRNLTWTDLRRLNQQSRYAVTLTRLLDGQTYELHPGSSRYTLPIPDAEIQASGLPQNPR